MFESLLLYAVVPKWGLALGHETNKNRLQCKAARTCVHAFMHKGLICECKASTPTLSHKHPTGLRSLAQWRVRLKACAEGALKAPFTNKKL